MSTNYYATFDTRLGRILTTASDEGITGLYFAGQKYEPAIGGTWTVAPGQAWLAAIRDQIGEYLAGARLTFDVPLDLQGTPFQQRVWRALLEIPAGTTVSYGDLAARVGAPTSARAVGAAVGRNPVSVIVPCHRVVGASGSLTGYAGGLDRKRALLDLERAMGPDLSWGAASALRVRPGLKACPTPAP